MPATGQLSSLTDDKIQVFVSPALLNFYSDDTSSHQTVMTLYNPYDFSLKYKVLCTAPKKYRVTASDGIVKARCCLDIFVRHKDVCPRNENVRDKFRIQVMKPGERTPIGKKDVPAVLLPIKERTPAPEEVFESVMPFSSVPQAQERLHGTGRPFTAAGERSRPSWLVIMACLVSIVCLILPSEVPENSMFPQFLCISDNKKLVAAYVLGLVTMYLFHS